MNKEQRIFLTILLVLSILLFIYSLWLSIPNEEVKEDTQDNLIENTTRKDFNLEYTFTDNNLWTYTVSGQLPNPCYEVSTEVRVAESYPEQVTVLVTVTEPDADTMCAQVIQEYEYSGEFNASGEATVTLQVK